MLKVDPHRHFGGSQSVAYVWRMIKKYNLPIAANEEEVRSRMTFGEDEKPDFQLFLKKFHILEKIPWTFDDVREGVFEAVKDVAEEGIDYCEMKFSLNKYGKERLKFASMICKTLNEASREYRTRVVPVLSLKYESEQQHQREISDAVLCNGVGEHVVALDLVGDERFFDSDFYRGISRDWISAGKTMMCHVGESQSGKNVRKAIKMGVTRIGHGIRAIWDDPAVLQEAKDRGVCFDMALSSNRFTGVVADLSQHPIGRFLEAGCEVTIGTDDPVVCSTTLDKEFQIAKEVVGLSDHHLNILKRNADERASVGMH